ncbi:outer membrane beta-barrel protein [Bradyrhizobium sp. NP1]|uniref:outer membrane protein n=1 Tax=Bradyrhizobium sp. NP1 TaxID=3049772 RepID=UPI0025A5FAC3|nr:outer membrane beta-barrel protein [Bradyrhizobium sp. NP1]WJR81066.1 outer membrane beta-barrel protein [Bradyrhizobium sp. NP1]
MKRLGLKVAAALLMFAGAASAADLPARTYTKAPPPIAPVTNWTGFYVGIDGGYGWTNNTGNGTFFTPAGIPFGPGTAAPPGNVAKAQGGLAGGTAGYNWQTGAIVWGIETDIQWSDIKGSGSVIDPCCSPTFPGPNGVYSASQNLTWFGTTRGRVGWLATPNLLLFATGGAFYGHENVSSTIFFPASGFMYPASNSTTRVGWTVGGGFEYLFASSWSAKVEGLYYDMGNINSSFTCPAGVATCTVGFTQTGTFALHGAIVRAGLNWHFNPGPVVARY